MTRKSFPIFRYVLILSLWLPSSLLLGQANSLEDRAFNELNLYVPDSGNPLTLWNKSDLKISFDRHSSKDYDYPMLVNQFKLGFSPLSNFYTTASLFHYERSGFIASGSYEEKMIMGDVGIGVYFAKISNSKKQRKWMMEKGWQINGLVGYSRGRMSHQDKYRIGRGEFNFNRVYGQTGFNLRRKIWGISANLKFGLLNYANASLMGQATSDLMPLSDLLMEKNNFFFFESASRIYLGTRSGQVHLNWVYAQ